MTLSKKQTTRSIRKSKNQNLQMLTCYDFQTAQMLNETSLDLILVGDSLGNVVLGYETTVEVTLDEMILFSRAVKRGAPDKFVVADMPFGTYASFEKGLENSLKLFQTSKAEALKLEGASDDLCDLILRLTENGVPVMGHIGLRPQSVHQMGGYFTHGKTYDSAQQLKKEAQKLEKAGCFAIVLECVDSEIAQEITQDLQIPTIGIGSGQKTDGQVLVLNDLLHMGKNDPPSFCTPIANLYEIKKQCVEEYLKSKQPQTKEINPKLA